jgi:hypothetical protein
MLSKLEPSQQVERPFLDISKFLIARLAVDIQRFQFLRGFTNVVGNRVIGACTGLPSTNVTDRRQEHRDDLGRDRPSSRRQCVEYQSAIVGDPTAPASTAKTDMRAVVIVIPATQGRPGP